MILYRPMGREGEGAEGGREREGEGRWEERAIISRSCGGCSTCVLNNTQLHSN